MSAIIQGNGDVVGPNGGVADGNLVVFNGTSGKLIRAGTLLPRNWLSGLVLSNGTDAINDINIAVGECRDDTNSADIALAGSLTKQLDAAWAAGTNQGGRDTGAIADGTWHMFAIKNLTSGVADVLMSLSITAPTMPSGYTLKRRIGSIIRRTNTIVAFRQIGDYFQIQTPILDLPATVMTQVHTTFALPNVPLGKKFYVDITARQQTNSATAILPWFIKDPDQDEAPLPTFSAQAINVSYALTISVWTNASAQLQSRIAATGPGTLLVSVLGYWDDRGKDV